MSRVPEELAATILRARDRLKDARWEVGAYADEGGSWWSAIHSKGVKCERADLTDLIETVNKVEIA